mmetsp:Transcript_72707/g.151798  ORF Transcript_72707/g.151798 Transcript_72707/m.151798 type:complete len:223 (+) Transcript_72707:372-1040(+)
MTSKNAVCTAKLAAANINGSTRKKGRMSRVVCNHVLMRASPNLMALTMASVFSGCNVDCTKRTDWALETNLAMMHLKGASHRICPRSGGTSFRFARILTPTASTMSTNASILLWMMLRRRPMSQSCLGSQTSRREPNAMTCFTSPKPPATLCKVGKVFWSSRKHLKKASMRISTNSFDGSVPAIARFAKTSVRLKKQLSTSLTSLGLSMLSMLESSSTGKMS